MSEPVIEIKNLCKSYTVDNKENAVIRNLNMTIETHRFVSILGYTGCGKSTLLRMICGLEECDEGEVLVHGKRVTAPSKDIILIYQDLDQLFPWKTAINNICYVIRKTDSKISKKEALEKAGNLLSRVGLEEFKSYYPSVGRNETKMCCCTCNSS